MSYPILVSAHMLSSLIKHAAGFVGWLSGESWKSFNSTLEWMFGDCNAKHEPYQDCLCVDPHFTSAYMLSQLHKHATPFMMGQLSMESRHLKECSVKEIRQGLNSENIAEVTMRVP